MSVFPKTRAAAGYIATAHAGELARARAAILLARLDACDDILSGDGGVPAALHGLLRDLVQAVRDLAGPAWLDASSHDPDVTAFTVLQAAASPPDPARTDEICSRVLWARFAPPAGQDDPGSDAPGQPVPGLAAGGQAKDTEASTTHSPHRTAVPGAAHPQQTDGSLPNGLSPSTAFCRWKNWPSKSIGPSARHSRLITSMPSASRATGLSHGSS